MLLVAAIEGGALGVGAEAGVELLAQDVAPNITVIIRKSRIFLLFSMFM